MQQPLLRRISPGRALLTSLGGVIALGSLLLALPFTQAAPVSFFDALFTSVSTVCVTGMQTVPISSFNFMGQLVILILMQIGGLGLMTFSLFIASLFSKMAMTSKLMAGQIFEFESWHHIKLFLGIILMVTLLLEGAGALLLFSTFKTLMPQNQAMFYALFHAVSAFCNAGISLFDNGMQTMSGNITVLATLASLVFAGGIGFVVWYEVAHSFRYFFAWIRNKARPLFSFSLHTKIALSTSLILTGFGTLCIWGLESAHSFKELDNFHSFINSIFLSISLRSAGFMVSDPATMANATILLFLLFMIIGASPGSTGSGIKTTTFALFCASVRAIISNRDAVEIDGRTIPNDQMQKVMAIVTIALSWIMFTSFLLLLFEPQHSFLKIIVESISAFSTCGISIGLTPLLGFKSKLVLMASMIAGRIGILTLVLSLRKNEQKYLYRYPEERVLLG